MDVRHETAPRRWSTARIVLVGAIGGGRDDDGRLEMIYGWASDTHTFWDARMAIWA